MSPRGRRPAGSLDAREAILVAARTAFACDGYQTSLRGIARGVGVDPVLVHHHFPDRATLSTKAVIELTAGVDANPMHWAASITESEPEYLEEGTVRAFISLWNNAGADRFTTVIHAALGQDSDVEPFRDFTTTRVLSLTVTRFCSDHPRLRAQLTVSQIIGLGLARWVTRMDHIASLDAETLVVLAGPTIQCYAFDDLPDLADSA